MKKLLKIISIFTFTTVSAINVNACVSFQNSPIDYQQLLVDAAKLIANSTDPNFINFLEDKNKTHVSDFEKLITKNIADLFRNATEDFSNLTYQITNGNEQVTTSTTIYIHLAVFGNSTTKDCSFNANFNSLQAYIDKKLAPLVNGKKYLSISKNDNDKDGFYQQLVAAGATFKKEDEFQKEQYFRNNTPKANNFWKEFQEWSPKQEQNPLLANVLQPLLLFIGDQPNTGLTFDNFKPYLLNIDDNDNVIAITGNKQFNGKDYDYIKIGLMGENSETADLTNQYQGLTFIFTTNS